MRRLPLLFVIIVPLLAASCIGETDHATNPRPFDAQLWRAASGDDRCNMVDDLLERTGLKGKTRAELIALLGEPETHDDPPDHYHLCPSFMDVWILEVEWENGRVASTRIRDT